MTSDLPGTPFHVRTAPLVQGQTWRRWAGYLVASSYELQHDREYHAIRSSAALIDVSPLFKYHIRGRDAVKLLDRVVTRDVSRAVPGQVLYTPWCDGQGKVLDDGTVSILTPEFLRLTSADPGFRWLWMNSRGLSVDIEDVSESIAALALQGPAARMILEEVTGSGLEGVAFFRLTNALIRGVPVTISRTGYTGDLGYEIWMDAGHALPVWDALMSVGGVHGLAPAGMMALDVARIEAGLLLLDVDYVSARKALVETQKSLPLELGLDWAVAFSKDAFVGRKALADASAAGVAVNFMGVEIDGESLESLYQEHGLAVSLPTVPWRSSVPIHERGTEHQVGYATSGCWSPLLKRCLALAHLEARYADPGRELEIEVSIEHRHRRARCRVKELPFFDPPRKRA